MQSYWFSDVPEKKIFPNFSGHLDVDVAIIGGGIAGLTTAYFASRAGLRVAVFEKNTIGSGDSGYTTALISHFLDETDATLKAWSAGEEAIEIIEDVVKSENINCEFRRVDAMSFTKKDAKQLKDDYENLLSVDSTIHFLEKEEASSLCGFDVSAAMLIKNEAEFHPRKYLFGLAKIIHANGGYVFEESPIGAIEKGGKSLILENGQINALMTVVASGGELKFFPEVEKLLSRYITFAVSARISSPRKLGNYIFWDDLAPYHYFRWEGKGELILGGEDVLAGEKKEDLNPHEKLAEFLESLIGKKCEILDKWQGSIFTTKDNLPYYGQHPAYGKSTYFATGFGGNGMTFGTLAGKMVSDMITGEKNKFAKLFNFDRKES